MWDMQIIRKKYPIDFKILLVTVLTGINKGVKDQGVFAAVSP